MLIKYIRDLCSLERSEKSGQAAVRSQFVVRLPEVLCLTLSCVFITTLAKYKINNLKFYSLKIVQSI